MTLVEAQLATSLVVVGGWIGSIAGGPLSDVSTQDVFYYSVYVFIMAYFTDIRPKTSYSCQQLVFYYWCCNVLGV